MVRFNIPLDLLEYSMLIHNTYHNKRLKQEVMEWIIVNAPKARVHIGLLDHHITFDDRGQAALAKLTWNLIDETVYE